jgi:hypothetical protein
MALHPGMRCVPEMNKAGRCPKGPAVLAKGSHLLPGALSSNIDAGTKLACLILRTMVPFVSDASLRLFGACAVLLVRGWGAHPTPVRLMQKVDTFMLGQGGREGGVLVHCHQPKEDALHRSITRVRLQILTKLRVSRPVNCT